MGSCFGCGGIESAQSRREKEPLLGRSTQTPTQTVPQQVTPKIELKIEPQVKLLTTPVSVSLQLPQEPKKTASIDRMPDVYYVIVGRGPAAVINHSTLRQSTFGKLRIGELPVLHIGFSNPWASYMQHGMGQPPHLLSLPGFEVQPTKGPDRDGGLDSKHFAKCVDVEMERVSKMGPTEVRTVWVAWIQKQGALTEPPEADFKDEMTGPEVHAEVLKACKEAYANFKDDVAPYRLIVVDPVKKKVDIVYAAYIDLCTGPGRPTVMKLNGGESAEYTLARTAPWLQPDVWKDAGSPQLAQRRILNAVDAIRDEVPWSKGERVCVTAGGGVGLNAAERSRNESCKLDWFARGSLRRPAFNNPRNVTFLWHKIENRVMKPGEKLVEEPNDGDLMPTAWNLRYGLGAVLSAATVPGKVEVTLAAAGNVNQIREFAGPPQALAVDHWGVSAKYTEETDVVASKLYDRLAIPNGQGPAALGQAEYLVKGIAVAPETVGTSDGRMGYLKSGDGRVRLLGAAAQTHTAHAWPPDSTIATRVVKTPTALMWDYRDVLALSAVPDGFILSGLNIAMANKYFVDHENQNVNTMGHEEMVALLNKAGLLGTDATDMATRIIGGRNAANGYANLAAVQKAAPGAPDCFSFGY